MTETHIPGSESHVDERNDVDSPTDALDPGADGTPEAATHPNAEAAKYRVRAREAETALATAQARIEQMTRREIERVAGEVLAAPADFWLSSNTTQDYIGDDGELDINRVRDDASLLVLERPRLSKNSPAFDPTQGSGGTGKPAVGWDQLLK